MVRDQTHNERRNDASERRKMCVQLRIILDTSENTYITELAMEDTKRGEKCAVINESTLPMIAPSEMGRTKVPLE